MPFARKPAVRVETVRFGGRTYRRYPDSDNPAHRRYFRCARGSLHRAVWEHHNGPVPSGHHVHHINGDTADNRIENLACMPAMQHHAEHSEDRSEFARQRTQHLADIRAKAAEWHRSDAGRAWHREHAEESLAAARAAKREQGAPDIACTCAWCGAAYVGHSSRSQFCSARCQTAESRFRRGVSGTEHPHHAARARHLR